MTTSTSITAESITKKTDAAQLPSASLFRRLSALIYDLFLLAAITFAYMLVVFTMRVIIEGVPDKHESLAMPGLFTQIISLLGWWLTLSYYYCYCWTKRGQTLAMKSWHIRLQQTDGSPATPKQCWLRVLMAPLSLLSVVGYLWCLFDSNGDCLHDKISDTRVVMIPK